MKMKVLVTVSVVVLTGLLTVLLFHTLLMTVFSTIQDSQLANLLVKKSIIWMGSTALLSMVILGSLSWWLCADVEKQLFRLRYEMDFIAQGNTDVEIKSGKTYEVEMLKEGLRAIQGYMEASTRRMDEAVDKRTKELSKKVVDLEKARDVMTESVLLAKKMQQERDQLLIQLQQQAIAKGTT